MPMNIIHFEIPQDIKAPSNPRTVVCFLLFCLAASITMIYVAKHPPQKFSL